MIKIGPILTIHSREFLPNMVEALCSDNERGSHHLNNLASEQLKREWPTVLAMADLIEKQRDALLKNLEEITADGPTLQWVLESRKLVEKIKQGSY